MAKSLLMGFVGILPFIAVAFVLWLIYQFIHDRLTHYDDVAEIKSDNVAAGINRAGAFLGVGIAASGSLIGNDRSFGEMLLWFFVDGLAAIVVFTIAAFAVDAVFLPRIRNADHILAGNKAVGVVEAAAYIGIGIITCASFSGGGQDVWPGLLSATLFSYLGLGLVVGAFALFCLAYRALYKCDVREQIKHGNVAMAIEVGGVLLAMSVTLWFSISGDFTGWLNDIAYFFIAAISSMASVSLAWFLSGRLLSRTPSIVKDEQTGRGIHQRNIAAAIIKMGAMGAFGLVAGLVTFA